ncbi:MAG: glycerol-3-phosphate dehydrogenase/oxidase [Planctomycetes bacterium]|nr:glycerol-3-phosphate dehydrogenase/oxidase [Planctomycetota bacterium]
MDRAKSLNRMGLDPDFVWDIVVVGGGATGASIALDAASRGYSVALIERSDFGKGTSSRATKLVHGGVRYLAQGNISLVREALKERTLLRQNAPHLVRELSFVVPCKNFFEKCWYRLGFWVYDWLAGASGFHRARGLTSSECLKLAPGLSPQRGRSGVLYSDGQFDDSRLLISILQTATEHGAAVVNYANVEALSKDASGRVHGVLFRDLERGDTYSLKSRCVINATGPFVDEVRRLDSNTNEPMVSASQGVHIVLSRDFLRGDSAVIVPKTSDGRVLFLIPWHDHVVVGTTDTPIERPVEEPRAFKEEIDFLLSTAGQYLMHQPTLADIQSVFTGIRPLVSNKGKGRNTAKLSRDHTIEVTPSGMITITGGKWTTARHMAEDCVNRAASLANLRHSPCITSTLPLHGYRSDKPHDGCNPSLDVYGSDRIALESLAASAPHYGKPLLDDWHQLREAEVVWAVRHEMARTIEDVLARRCRLLFLDTRKAEIAAPAVAEIMARELHRGSDWVDQQLQDFHKLLESYRI